MKIMHCTFLVLFTTALFIQAKAQTVLSLDSAINLALANHPLMQFSQQEIAQKKAQKGGSFNLPNPQVMVQATYAPKYMVGVQQTIDNPLVYIQQGKFYQQNINATNQSAAVNKNNLISEVKSLYLQLQYAQLMVEQLNYRDSIFKLLYETSERRYQSGDANMLEKISTETEWKKVNNLLAQSKSDFENTQVQLQLLLGTRSDTPPIASPLVKNSYAIDSSNSLAKESPLLNLYQENVLLGERNIKLQQSKLAPGLILGYLNQTEDNVPLNYKFQAGLSLPLWFWTYNAQIKSARYEYEMKQSEYKMASIKINSSYQQAMTDLTKYQQTLTYYETFALPQAETIISTAKRSYEAGEIDYMLYLQSLNQAFEIKMGYYESLKNYNQSIIQINSISGQQ